MVQNKEWCYCQDTTKKHILLNNNRDCIVIIHDIAKQEGCKNPPFNKSDEALCLDKLERKKRRVQQNCTMDIAIGIKKDTRFKTLVRMFLIEFRFNYKTPRNIKVSEFEDKITYSKSLIGQEPLIHNKFLFIFQPNIVSQAKSTVARLYKNNPQLINSRIICDVNYLHKEYF